MMEMSFRGCIYGLQRVGKVKARRRLVEVFCMSPATMELQQRNCERIVTKAFAYVVASLQ